MEKFEGLGVMLGWRIEGVVLFVGGGMRRTSEGAWEGRDRLHARRHRSK